MVEIAPFGVETWLNKWEKSASYDISQSTIASLTMHEVLNLDGHHGQEFYAMLDQQKMNYGWIEGSPEFKEEVAKLYDHVDPENILQTNGATGANILALYSLINPGGPRDRGVPFLPTALRHPQVTRGPGRLLAHR